MAVRTNAADVKEVLNDSTLVDAVVDNFIIGANALLNNILGTDTTLGDTLMEEIEKWLSAHMIAVTPNSRATQTEKLGEASVKYTGLFKENLSSTMYGQMVLTLDTTGKMAASGKRTANITAITSFE